MVQLYLFACAIVGLGALWFYVLRPMLEDFGWLLPRESVKEEAETTPVSPPHTMSTSLQTDDRQQTADVSAEERIILDSLQVDRTRKSLIVLLLYSGWKPSEIRPLFRGDNNVLSAEIETVRQALDAPPDEPIKVREAGEEYEVKRAQPGLRSFARVGKR